MKPSPICKGGASFLDNEVDMNHTNLSEERVSVLFSRYLVPSISATLVTSIYILADTVMIGQGVGAIGIGALNLMLPLFNLFFGTGILFGVGGGVLLSVAKGKGKEQEAREYFTMALLCAGVAALIYGVGFQVFFQPVTRLLGSNDTMEEYVNAYGRVLCAGAPAFLFSSFLQAFVRNDKAPKKAMFAVMAGGVSNVILDYIFIFPMKMGMAGAAIASVIGSLITMAILVTHFFSDRNTLKTVRVLDLQKAWQIVVNGGSSFLMEMANGIVIFLFNRQLLTYVGDMGVVVYGIISNSALVVNSVCNGIGQAVQPILAVNYGAGKKERVAETKRLGVIAAAVAGISFMVVGLSVPQLITEAFVAPTKEILGMAVPAVRLYFLSFSAMGFNILFSTYFQSVMKPVYALAICLLRGLVLSGLFVFLLPVLFGVNGIWVTMAVAEFLTLAVCIVFLRRE